jgi:RNA polymerase sigma-70 factor, ECF subfamily
MERTYFLPDQNLKDRAAPSPGLPDSAQSSIAHPKPTNNKGTQFLSEQSKNSKGNGSGRLGGSDPDHALVAACRVGNRQAFNDLVRRHKDHVCTIAVRLLGDHSEAEDIAQETFFRAYEGIARFRGDAKFSSWLYRICYNLCLNHAERKKHTPGDDPLPEMLVDPAARLPEQLIAKERQELVQWALSCLTPEFREVVVLYHTGQLSYEEIATLQRLPIGTVRSRLHRGREELKELLRPYLQEEE